MNQDELTEMAESAKRRPDGTRDESHRLVTHLNPKSPISEAYRTLRTNLQFSSTTDPVRSFLVTSAGPGEGKSTTTANLAIAMSLQGTRTILVDTDLRKPVVHKIFGVDKNRGLTNVLIGKMESSEVIQKSRIQNLDVIPAGILPPNPAELLGSQRMKDLVAELRESYDMCLFDSPPLIAVTDAAVLSKELDGILLVVKSGHTHREALNRGLELVRNVDSRILGVLLNDVSRENTYGSSYYYYNNYYYAGEGESKKRRKRKRVKTVESEEVHTVEL
jgi:tyrosine-protein kinase Etk/Wzc